ncbi:MAG: hypothetical protein IJX16_00185 [Clostridia bacterium]|nr:hypothetical protein [Clostridia bacterium]
MVVNNAQATVLLSSIMATEQGKEALNKALSTYPLYRGKKDYDLIPTREALNEKILNRYKYREIGFETVGRFLFELENTMKLIMPYYNEMFKTVEIMADLENPFDNVDVTETFSEERTANTTGTHGEESTSNSTGKTTTSDNATTDATSDATGTLQNTTTKTTKMSDTPQNNVDDLNKYLTQYNQDSATTNQHTSDIVLNSSETTGTSEANSESATTNSVEGNSTTNVTGSTQHTFTKKGNQGVNTYAHDMLEFRLTINDYVEQIVNDERINELFLLVW